VLVADIQGAKSYIHIIDHVLVPDLAPTPAPTYDTIAAALVANNCTTLVAAVTAAGGDLYAAATSPDAAVTVFAPTNAVSAGHLS
jgi:uncharacterized surface protein with fasciclin (FAS1) repeats